MTRFEYGADVEVRFSGTVSTVHGQDQWLVIRLDDGRQVHLPLPLRDAVTVTPQPSGATS